MHLGPGNLLAKLYKGYWARQGIWIRHAFAWTGITLPAWAGVNQRMMTKKRIPTHVGVNGARVMSRDLHELSRLEDSLSYLYVDKAVIERDENSIVIQRMNERIPVPISSLTVLMLGPGTNLTHAAIKVFADSGCLVIWCGEGALRFYGYGMGETRSAGNLLRQAQCCMDAQKHLEVVRRMFGLRFTGMDLSGKSLQQLRGMEGIRMRETYKLMASKHGLIWKGRNYKLEE